ncbi:hypothetical protein ADEAN_000099800 [Angomonas deanei]|uniref:Uncharacterized protein n=1 Tax=Angomonas deanei TaxID=59799 RepID=A0A7G2C1Y3_9TRYP|nr:hypothetical protein ADEAN_000099800 [Angomonas deanei]
MTPNTTFEVPSLSYESPPPATSASLPPFEELAHPQVRQESKTSYWGRGAQKDSHPCTPVDSLVSCNPSTHAFPTSFNDPKQKSKSADDVAAINRLMNPAGGPPLAQPGSSHFESQVSFSSHRPTFSSFATVGGGGLHHKASVTFMENLVERSKPSGAPALIPSLLPTTVEDQPRSCMKKGKKKTGGGLKLLVPEMSDNHGEHSDDDDDDEGDDGDLEASGHLRPVGNKFSGQYSFDRTPVQSFSMSQGNYLPNAFSVGNSANQSFNPSYNASFNPSFSLKGCHSLGTSSKTRHRRKNSTLKAGSVSHACSLERDAARKSPVRRKEKLRIKKRHVGNGGFVLIEKEGEAAASSSLKDAAYYQKVPSFRVYGTAAYNVNPDNFKK